MRGAALLVPLNLVALVALAGLACESPRSTPEAQAQAQAQAPAAAAAPMASVFASASGSAPWPTPPAYDLAADLGLRTALAGRHLFSMSTTVQDGVFVLAAPYPYLLEKARPIVHDALGALLNGRFTRPPSRAVTVYVLGDSERFDYLCNERLGRKCGDWLGVWIKETREVLVDVEPGNSTLVHELVHPLLAADAEAGPGGRAAWAAPRWVREGIAALFEQPVIKGGEIHGATNWRLEDLRHAQGSPVDKELVHLDALFRMPDDLFDGEKARAAYAVARFACQWMDSPGQDRLWRFYRAWRGRAPDDPTGEASFAEVFGQTPREADAAWQKWLWTVRRPR
jgi:hypothetical protein